MNTVHNIAPAGDDGAKLKVCSELFEMLSADIWTLRNVLSAITCEGGMEQAMDRLAAAEALVALIGQRTDEAAQRLGAVCFTGEWVLSPRGEELLDLLGPRRRRPAA